MPSTWLPPEANTLTLPPKPVPEDEPGQRPDRPPCPLPEGQQDSPKEADEPVPLLVPRSIKPPVPVPPRPSQLQQSGPSRRLRRHSHWRLAKVVPSMPNRGIPDRPDENRSATAVPGIDSCCARLPAIAVRRRKYVSADETVSRPGWISTVRPCRFRRRRQWAAATAISIGCHVEFRRRPDEPPPWASNQLLAAVADWPS